MNITSSLGTFDSIEDADEAGFWADDIDAETIAAEMRAEMADERRHFRGPIRATAI